MISATWQSSHFIQWMSWGVCHHSASVVKLTIGSVEYDEIMGIGSRNIFFQLWSYNVLYGFWCWLLDSSSSNTKHAYVLNVYLTNSSQSGRLSSTSSKSICSEISDQMNFKVGIRLKCFSLWAKTCLILPELLHNHTNTRRRSTARALVETLILASEKSAVTSTLVTDVAVKCVSGGESPVDFTWPVQIMSVTSSRIIRDNRPFMTRELMSGLSANNRDSGGDLPGMEVWWRSEADTELSIKWRKTSRFKNLHSLLI